MDKDNCKSTSLKWVQLPNGAKKVGLALAIISFALILVIKFTSDSEILKTLFRYLSLIGLLVISISKEKIEDELVIKLRMQSYMVACIGIAIYAIVMPFIEVLVDLLRDKEMVLKDLGDFLLIFSLLVIQVASFESLKGNTHEEFLKS